MYEFKTYEDPELQKIWAGYVEGPRYTTWFPADGDWPVTFPNEVARAVEPKNIKGHNWTLTELILTGGEDEEERISLTDSGGFGSDSDYEIPDESLRPKTWE